MVSGIAPWAVSVSPPATPAAVDWAATPPLLKRSGMVSVKNLERVCILLGVKPAKTFRQTLMRVKTHVLEERKREVIYEVPCKECPRTYIRRPRGCSR